MLSCSLCGYAAHFPLWVALSFMHLFGRVDVCVVMSSGILIVVDQ
jgi:hypothetical protein